MFACDERTSMAWARDSVRGIASRLIAVTPRSASCCMSPGSMSGVSSPISAWPERNRPTSAGDGFWIFTTQSAWAYTSSVETIVAPASSYAASGKAAAVPASCSTRISSPAALSLARASGTSATRRSPGKVSLGTPTFMWAPGGRGLATGYRARAHAASVPAATPTAARCRSGRHHRDPVALERGDRPSVVLRDRRRPARRDVDQHERHARRAHEAMVVEPVGGALDRHAAVADPRRPHVHVEQLVEPGRGLIGDLEGPHHELALALPVRLQPQVAVVLQPRIVEVGQVAPVVDDPLCVRVGERNARQRRIAEWGVPVRQVPGLEVRHARILRRARRAVRRVRAWRRT